MLYNAPNALNRLILMTLGNVLRFMYKSMYVYKECPLFFYTIVKECLLFSYTSVFMCSTMLLLSIIVGYATLYNVVYSCIHTL